MTALEHEREQNQINAVKPRCPLLEIAVVDAREQVHHADTHDRIENLLLVFAGSAGRVQVGRLNGNETEQCQRTRRGDQVPIDVAQIPPCLVREGNGSHSPELSADSGVCPCQASAVVEQSLARAPTMQALGAVAVADGLKGWATSLTFTGTALALQDTFYPAHIFRFRPNTISTPTAACSPAKSRAGSCALRTLEAHSPYESAPSNVARTIRATSKNRRVAPRLCWASFDELRMTKVGSG